ncbi:hypothetical protein EDB19DRAFT_394052 [Suillus lakei]|nr:hypothetical protein EDB19DRAFT_394052 [Suillus lakei]
MCPSMSIRGGTGNHPSEYHQSTVGRYCDFVKSITTFGCASSTDHLFVDHYKVYLNYRLRTFLRVRESDTLARKLSELGKSLSDAQGPATITDRVAVYVAEREYGRLVTQWEAVVAEIRNLEGFSRFLPLPLCEGVKVAARYFPVIILISNEYLCGAIVVPTSGEPHHVRFTHITYTSGQPGHSTMLQTR